MCIFKSKQKKYFKKQLNVLFNLTLLKSTGVLRTMKVYTKAAFKWAFILLYYLQVQFKKYIFLRFQVYQVHIQHN